MSDHEKPPADQGFFEKPGTIRALWIILIVLCIFFAGAGFWAQMEHKLHPHTALDRIPVFYAIFGFLSFSFIVLVGQHLRLILMRDEHYYDPPEPVPGKSQEAKDG